MSRELKFSDEENHGKRRSSLNNPIEGEMPFDLGQWLGRKQAFGLIAGKTAAAEVECLRQIRDGNLFRAKADDWAEFCLKYAGVTSSYAGVEKNGSNLLRLPPTKVGV